MNQKTDTIRFTSFAAMTAAAYLFLASLFFLLANLFDGLAN